MAGVISLLPARALGAPSTSGRDALRADSLAWFQSVVASSMPHPRTQGPWVCAGLNCVRAVMGQSLASGHVAGPQGNGDREIVASGLGHSGSSAPFGGDRPGPLKPPGRRVRRRKSETERDVATAASPVLTEVVGPLPEGSQPVMDAGTPVGVDLETEAAAAVLELTYRRPAAARERPVAERRRLATKRRGLSVERGGGGMLKEKVAGERLQHGELDAGDNYFQNDPSKEQKSVQRGTLVSEEHGVGRLAVENQAGAAVVESRGVARGNWDQGGKLQASKIAVEGPAKLPLRKGMSVWRRVHRSTEKGLQGSRGPKVTGPSVESVPSLELVGGGTSKRGFMAREGSAAGQEVRGRRGLLSPEEEAALAAHLQSLKELEALRMSLQASGSGQPPAVVSEFDWAAAAGIGTRELNGRLRKGLEAQRQLIEANTGLIFKAAHRYHRMAITAGAFLAFPDLVQIAAVSLLDSLLKFDSSRGFRFSTFAMDSMHNALRNTIVKHGRAIRVPRNRLQLQSSILQGKEELFAITGRPPTMEDLASHLGLTVQAVRRAALTVRPPLSLESLTFSNEFQAESVDAERGVLPAASELETMLDSLQPKEREVLRQRFGFDGEGPKSLVQVAANMSLSRQMIHKYEKRALQKLTSGLL